DVCRSCARQQDPEGCHRKKVLTPVELSQGVSYILEEHPVSISRACKLVGYNRSNYYYRSKKDDGELIDVLSSLAEKHSGYGFWKLYKRMRKMDYKWNHKRVYRIYKLLNLSMRRKSKKRLP